VLLLAGFEGIVQQRLKVVDLYNNGLFKLVIALLQILLFYVSIFIKQFKGIVQ
jgi:hypothetical protein